MTVNNGYRLLATGILVAMTMGAMAVVATLGILSSSRSVQSFGAVKAINIGVYWDSTCTNATSTVDWGMLSPGNAKNVTVYVQNAGNLALTLNLTTQNWSPTDAASYIGLIWNREGQVVTSGSVVAAVLTLSVSPSISGITNFGFEIVVTGVER